MEAIMRFRQGLKDGHIYLGTAITFTDPLVTDSLGDSVDFFWLDSEHTAKSPECLAGHLLAARARNKAALVRVPSSNTAFIKGALDAGADGVIVPQIRTAEEVRQIVRDCRYPPVGQRGWGPRAGMNYGRVSVKDYIEASNKGVYVSVQIETREALENLDEIVNVPGLDCIVLGLWDLSGSMGLLGQTTHPDVIAGTDRIISAARGAGLNVGIGLGMNVDQICDLARRGVQWFHVASDYDYLISTADGLFASVRERLG